MHSPAARLNVASVVNHFGGRANLVRLSVEHGSSPAPAYEAVKKWVQRGRIPGEHLAALTMLGVALDKPLTLSDHMTTTTHHKDSTDA